MVPPASAGRWLEPTAPVGRLRARRRPDQDRLVLRLIDDRSALGLPSGSSRMPAGPLQVCSVIKGDVASTADAEALSREVKADVP